MRSAVFLVSIFVSAACRAEECPALVEYGALTTKVTEKFYDRSFRGLDWNARVADYRTHITCGDAKEKVAATVNQLLAELGTSHTGVYVSGDLDYWALQSIYSRSLSDYSVPLSGIWPERYEDNWYAKYVLPGSPADTAKIYPGDQLISVDSKPFDPLGFKEGIASSVVVSSDGKKRRNVKVTPKIESAQQLFLDASEHSQRTIFMSGHRIGYFHLWAGTHEAFLKALENSLAEFEAARVDAFILDLRGGYGGASVDYLTKLKGSAYFASIPKFVLIDDGVRSGKELLAATIKHENLATLIGSKTAGAFLGGSPVRLFDNKYFLYVPVGAWFPPEIGPLEGVGVEPDISVQACRMFCGGTDQQLNRALEAANESLASARHL